jgi:hypothetical protein
VGQPETIRRKKFHNGFRDLYNWKDEGIALSVSEDTTRLSDNAIDGRYIWLPVELEDS